MRSTAKLLGAAVIAGALATSGSAFTAAGVNLSGVSSPLFHGGRVALNVDGTTLSNVAFNTIANQPERVHSIALTLDVNAVGKAVTMTASAPSPGGWSTAPEADGFTCSTITGSPYVSTCVTTLSTATVPTDEVTGGYVTGLEQITITVVNP